MNKILHIFTGICVVLALTIYILLLAMMTYDFLNVELGETQDQLRVCQESVEMWEVRGNEARVSR